MERVKKFLFINTSTKQTVIKNTFWLFVGEFGIRILKLFLFVYAARKLGSSEWGIFSYALAIMSTFAIISDIGVNTILLREIAKKVNNVNQYISTSFFIKFGLSIFSSLSLLSVMIFMGKDSTVKMLIPLTALILFFDSIREFGFSINRAYEKMEMEAFIKLITTTLLIILAVIFINQKTNASSILYSYLISGIIGVIIMYINIKKYFVKIKKNFNKILILPILKEAWPIAIVGVLGTIMTNLDTIILGWFVGPSDIGIYSAAQKPVQIIYLIPALAGIAIFPVLSRLAAEEKSKMDDIIKKATRLSFLISLVIIFFIFIIGGFVFKIMFGNQYIESIPLFKIMSLSIITGSSAMIINNAMMAMGKQKNIIQFIAINLILNLFFCFILIPKIGIYGATLSVVLSQTLGNILLIIKSRKILN